MQRLQLVVRHGGAHYRVDVGTPIDAHPVDQRLNSQLQVVAGWRGNKARVVNREPGGNGFAAAADHHLAVTESARLTGKRCPLHEQTLQAAEERGGEGPAVADPAEAVVCRREVVQDLHELGRSWGVFVCSQNLGERGVGPFERGGALSFTAKGRETQQGWVRQLPGHIVQCRE